MQRLRLARLAPGAAARLNVIADLVLLWAGLICATGASRHYEVWLGLPLSLAWLVSATALRNYDPWAVERQSLDDAAMASVAVMSVATLLGVVKLMSPVGAPDPQVGTFLLVFWPTVVVARLLVFRNLARREEPLDEVLIVGTGPMGRATGSDLRGKGRHRVVGYLSYPGEVPPAELGNLYLGGSETLDGMLKTIAISEVYIAGNAVKQAEAMQKAIKTCERYGIPFALPAYSFRLDRAQPSSDAVADGYLHYHSGTIKPHQLALKRLFDILVSGIAVWALLPLFGVVAALIRLTSPGPVFFRQVRVGLRGKPFRMLKFRSMVVDAEKLRERLAANNEQRGPVFKMAQDPRVTAVGRFIRKYSIDELPQLINVLRGDMSIVGPRPPLPAEVNQYEAWQRRRLAVRPGLTCIWQVSGRNRISFEEWMYLDMRYIDHWSLAEDLNLVLRTFPVVFSGRGAS
jgi:exopolysaccharide biosynthesis polyprenyl glycosylphosphotransferase